MIIDRCSNSWRGREPRRVKRLELVDVFEEEPVYLHLVGGFPRSAGRDFAAGAGARPPCSVPDPHVHLAGERGRDAGAALSAKADRHRQREYADRRVPDWACERPPRWINSALHASRPAAPRRCCRNHRQQERALRSSSSPRRETSKHLLPRTCDRHRTSDLGLLRGSAATCLHLPRTVR